MKRTLVALLLIGATGLAVPTAQAVPEDVYPPLIPGGRVDHIVGQLHDLQDGEVRYCQGYFVLRAGCEIHAEDKRVLGIAHWAQPIPSGNGTELSSWIEIRVYDLDQGGELVHTCRHTEVDDGSDPVLTINQAVQYQTIAGPSSCDDPDGDGEFYSFGTPDDLQDANFRFEIESNTTGRVRLFVF